jgi:hypothetical protein
MARRVRRKRKQTCETPKKRVWGVWDDEPVPRNGKRALTEIEKLR